jgi:HK97 gp10 family phage protein
MARRGSRERTLAILTAIPKEIKKAVRAEIEKQAGSIVDSQKRLVAEQSGDLRDSIRFQMGNVELDSSANLASGKAGQGDPDLTATIIAGDRKAFYARFVEFGTAPHENGGEFAGTQHPGTAPQPFFYGPFRSNKKRAKSAVSRAISKAVRAAVNK